VKSYRTFVVVLGVLTIGLALSVELPAAPTLKCTPFNTTLSSDIGWPAYSDGVLNVDGIQQQDKIWKFVSQTGFEASQTAHFNLLTPGGIDNHSLSIGDGGDPIGVGLRSMQYLLSVVPEAPLSEIYTAKLAVDADGSTGNWSVTKLLYSGRATPANLIGTLTVNQATPGGLAAINFAGQTSLNVVETWFADANSTLVSTTNTFVQGDVPEPAALVIWSVLGAGTWFGMRVWRRKRTGPIDVGGSRAPRPARNVWSAEDRRAIYSIISLGAPR
jgi:hypothetical protein